MSRTVGKDYLSCHVTLACLAGSSGVDAVV